MGTATKTKSAGSKLASGETGRARPTKASRRLVRSAPLATMFKKILDAIVTSMNEHPKYNSALSKNDGVVAGNNLTIDKATKQQLVRDAEELCGDVIGRHIQRVTVNGQDRVLLNMSYSPVESPDN